ncbi:hypothetical protein ACFYU9_05500 [Streptomyces sp. NPDC004327]|uniref:hypothetical protein n=1 Tax=Streptomyces sp. NPDC004327 TaxID=3364699 RepID=UPI0036A09104
MIGEQQVRPQALGRVQQPVVQQRLQLRVQGDVAVGVHLADRDKVDLGLLAGPVEFRNHALTASGPVRLLPDLKPANAQVVVKGGVGDGREAVLIARIDSEQRNEDAKGQF